MENLLCVVANMSEQIGVRCELKSRFSLIRFYGNFVLKDAFCTRQGVVTRPYVRGFRMWCKQLWFKGYSGVTYDH